MKPTESGKLKQQLLTERLIVIARDIPAPSLLPLGEALYFAGVRFLELPFPANAGAESDKNHAAKIAVLAKAFRGRMQIGGGTILTSSQVELTKAAGGSFLLSPDVNEAVIRATKAAGLLSIPAGFTPTEIRKAYDAGADFVKFFPASVAGPDYIKAVLGPLSYIPIIAMGGVTLDSIPAYLAAGAKGFGIGGGIVDRELLQKNDFEGIFRLSKTYVEKIKS
ncbi:MAG: bifunctional 4-hydroxy-2-oxoglutarate aldolase/2-dehydro-3-deoxy-phosphogluconate aldolase [Clostridia bacterium]|nr:bifunctional 4-hydroxy-2-oxoglutarate aldolase/2-dehydro-3-deoxy-phosphogluconate aldolase [Clostridia bacterium]